MLGPFPILLSLMVTAAVCLPAAVDWNAQDSAARLRTQFQQESDPVRKAKAACKFGDAQIKQMRGEIDAGNVSGALQTLEDYRNTIRTAFAGLKESGINAEKKPSGFKQLQLHLRSNLGRLLDSVMSIPLDEREPFEAIRKELEKMDNELIDMLFPRQPGKRIPDRKRN